jgi:hypothetical protein
MFMRLPPLIGLPLNTETLLKNMTAGDRNLIRKFSTKEELRSGDEAGWQCYRPDKLNRGNPRQWCLNTYSLNRRYLKHFYGIC